MKKIILYFSLLSHLILFAQPAKEPFNAIDKNGQKQGYWRKYYPNGKLRYEGNFKDNKAMGVFSYYYPSGKLQATNTYSLNGTKTAALIYFENGKIQARGNFINEKKDSVWLYYNTEEKQIAEECYQLNKKNGLSKTYYLNGNVADATTWDKDEKIGEWKTFWENGSLKSTATLNKGDIDGRITYYHENGRIDLIGDYKNGNREGEWISYHPDGKIKDKEIYVNGYLKESKIINGIAEEFFQDDILKSRYTFKEGNKEGDFIEYFEGAIKKREVRKGEEGYPDETIEIIVNHFPKIKGKYKNNKLDGEITSYKPNGKVDKIEIYVEGILTGKK